jgi:hypothetical protein
MTLKECNFSVTENDTFKAVLLQTLQEDPRMRAQNLFEANLILDSSRTNIKSPFHI